MGVSLRLLMMLILVQTLFANPSPPDVTVTSPPSEASNDALTIANCPAGYSMINCRLSADSSYFHSDGLKFQGNACTARANHRGYSVRVTLFTSSESM